MLLAECTLHACMMLIALQEAHLSHGPIGILEVWLQEGIKEIASDALNGVING